MAASDDLRTKSLEELDNLAQYLNEQLSMHLSTERRDELIRRWRQVQDEVRNRGIRP